MQRILGGVGLATMLVFAGCNSWPHTRGKNVQPIGAAVPAGAPTAARLVEYMNQNAQRVPGLICSDLDVDVKHGIQAVGLSGKMACQKPRGFRMTAKVAGNAEVDLGSNEQEFWYWLRRAEPKPYVFHCSYEDFSRGQCRYMPFPFQPDWILEALGIAEYDPNKPYELLTKQDRYELVENTVSPQGQRLRKVTVFNKAQAASGRPQVTAHLLQTAEGREICSAYVTEVQWDQASGASLPRRVHIVCPLQNREQERTEMKLKLDGVRVATIAPEQGRDLFSRAALSGLPAFDLARGSEAPEAGPVRRVRGQSR